MRPHSPGLNKRDFNTPCVIIQRPHTRPQLPTQQHTSLDTCFSGSFSSWRNLHLKWGEFPQHCPKRLTQPHFAFGLWMESSACIQAAFFFIIFFLNKVQLQSKNMTTKNALLYILIYPTSDTLTLFQFIQVQDGCLLRIIALLFPVEFLWLPFHVSTLPLIFCH